MKRSTFLTALSILPILLASCEKPLPTSATIVKGNLVDENNNPIEGIEFQIGGSYPRGVTRFSTFDDNVWTDKQGNFKSERVVTSPTDFVEVGPIGDGYPDKKYLFQNNKGIFVETNLPTPVAIGIEKVYNFKLVKR